MVDTCKWNELRDGDVFILDSSYKDSWAEAIHFWPPRGFMLQRKGDKVVFFPQSPDTGAGYSYYPGSDNSPVLRRFSIGDIPPDVLFKGLRSRQNSCTGSDPEIFVVRGVAHRTLLPAFKYLPKQEEQAAKFAGGYGAFGEIDSRLPAYAYRDGFAAECFIHPVRCHGYLINYLRQGLYAVLVAARNFDRTAQLTIKNTFTIPAVTMDNAQEDDIALGCMPSLNAYNDSPELPLNARDFRLRFAGGHVHFGIASLAEDTARNMIRACDVLAAIPAVAIFASLDTPLRRQFYGRAGEYRKPKHGLEYRVLSNAWLATPEIAHLILNLVRIGLKVGAAGYLSILDIEEDAVRNIINHCDVKAARQYVKSHLEMFHILLSNDGIYRSTESERAFKQIVEGGIEAVLPDFQSVETNWRLSGRWDGESNNNNATWGALCRRHSGK